MFIQGLHDKLLDREPPHLGCGFDFPGIDSRDLNGYPLELDVCYLFFGLDHAGMKCLLILYALEINVRHE